MLYYIMLAAAVGVYENFHLGLKVLTDSVSENSRRRLVIFNNSLILIFGIAMFICGARLAQFTADHIIPTLEISRSLAYLPFSIAGLLISIFALEKILVAIANKNSLQSTKDAQAA